MALRDEEDDDERLEIRDGVLEEGVLLWTE